MDIQTTKPQNDQLNQTQPIQNQPSDPTKKGGIKFGLSIAIVIILLFATAVAVYWIRTEPTEQSLINIVTKKSTDQIANWQTYQNEQYGFEFKYPKDWSVVFTKELTDKVRSIGINIENNNLDNLIAGIKEFGGFPASPDKITVDGHDSYSLIAGDAGNGVESVYIYINGNTTIQLSGTFADDSISSLDEQQNIFNQILSTFKFTTSDPTASWQTYQNEQYGFEFKYNPKWSIAPINTGSGYNPSQPFILLWAGTVSDSPCQDLGCPPKSGDRDELTKGDTFEGAPPLNPWFKILRVRGNNWVSIQLTDTTKICSSETSCQQYLSSAPLEQRVKVNDLNYQTYNDFINLLSTFKFTP